MTSSWLGPLRVWAETIKLPHSVFALPFALTSAFLAGRHIEPLQRPDGGRLFLVIFCMIAARSAAMTFNRIVDRHIDARNPRTAGRALPAKLLSVSAAYVFFSLSALAFFAGCYGFLAVYSNIWPVSLCVPVLLFICGYSYAKRLTRWSHFVLGAAIGFSPVAAWLAVHPASIGWPAVILAAAVMLWVAGFDVIYACQDIEVDREQGLHSLPSRMGPRNALLVTRVCHFLVVALLALLGYLTGLGTLYACGVGAAAVLLVIENFLVRPTDFSRVNLSFFTINGVVSLVVGGLAIVDILGARSLGH